MFRVGFNIESLYMSNAVSSVALALSPFRVLKTYRNTMISDLDIVYTSCAQYVQFATPETPMSFKQLRVVFERFEVWEMKHIVARY